MKITDVEAIVLRQAVVDDGIADGSQDDLVVRIHTDEGITGIGEVDSSPELVQALVQAPSSHAVATSLRDALVGEDPLDVERLWHKMYRGLIYFGRRGIAIHAISGLDIALWDIKGKALGKPVCELLGTPQRDRVRAYASMLMPDTTDGGRRERVDRARASRASPRSSSAGGRSGRIRRTTSRSPRPRRRPAGDGVEILIDAGPRLRRRREDGDRGRARARAARRSTGSRSRSSRTSTRRTPSSPTRSTSAIAAGEQDATLLGLPRADRARPRRPRPARRDALRRHHRDAADRRARARAAASRRCRTRGRAGSSRRRRCT